MERQLQHWTTTRQFCRIVDTACSYCDSENFWGARQKWLREASLARSLAVAAHAKRVRLGSDSCGGADSELELRNGAVLRLQHVEADLPGRRRGDEYKAWAKDEFRLRHDPFCNWEKRRDEFPAAVGQAVENKIRKKLEGKYDETISLLIYVNLGTYGKWRDRLECELIKQTHLASPHFRSVWAWWSGRLYRCWPNPFLGGPDTFRPGPHSLGWSLEKYAEQKMLNSIFHSTVDCDGIGVRPSNLSTPST